jgi:Ser/Thr protein kinase RdoA (MazF antagonist)
MDDAGGGRRGSRPEPSAGLARLLTAGWGLAGPTTDLGGSENLNLLVEQPEGAYVARVYRPHVSVARLEAIQKARRHLSQVGVPVALPVPDSNGACSARLGDNLIEVERYVVSHAKMDSLARVGEGLRLLGRIHTALGDLGLEMEGIEPAFANHVPSAGLTDRVRVGTGRIRGWGPTDEERRVADLADRLAESLEEREAQFPLPVTQPVHGDFWDDNVLFSPNGIALVTDFGMMGQRPRTDDLALTLFFTSIDVADLSYDTVLLDDLLVAYRRDLSPPLSDVELQAVPLAICRQPLWSIAVWVAQLDDVQSARRHLAGTAPELEWGLRFLEGLGGCR